MAQRQPVQTPVKTPVKPAPQPVVEEAEVDTFGLTPEELEELAELEQELAEMEGGEEEEAPVAPAPKTVPAARPAARPVAVAPKAAVPAARPVVAAPKAAVPATRPAAVAPQPPAAKVAPKPAAAPKEEKAEDGSFKVAVDNISALLEAIQPGQMIVMQRTSAKSFTFFQPTELKGEVLKGKGRRSTTRAVKKTLYDPAYTQWREEWNQKTYEEKLAFAEANGITWERHERPEIDMIRMSSAVREHLGVEKYLPEFRDPAARKAAYDEAAA